MSYCKIWIYKVGVNLKCTLWMLVVTFKNCNNLMFSTFLPCGPNAPKDICRVRIWCFNHIAISGPNESKPFCKVTIWCFQPYCKMSKAQSSNVTHNLSYWWQIPNSIKISIFSYAYNHTSISNINVHIRSPTAICQRHNL